MAKVKPPPPWVRKAQANSRKAKQAGRRALKAGQDSTWRDGKPFYVLKPPKIKKI